LTGKTTAFWLKVIDLTGKKTEAMCVFE